MYTDRDDQLSQLLGSSIEWLDITDQRCWTLQYPGFHVDVLGAVLDEQAGGTGISITDTEVRRWLPSDPMGSARRRRCRAGPRFRRG